MPNGDWEKRIETIEKSTNSIQSDVKEIKLALSGSEQIGLKGFATRMKDVECYVEKDKKQKWMIRGGIIVIGTLWAVFKFIFSKP